VKDGMKLVVVKICPVAPAIVAIGAVSGFLVLLRNHLSMKYNLFEIYQAYRFKSGK